MAIQAVRGAITADADHADAIREAVAEMVATLLTWNDITPAQIRAVFFTTTPDLTALNPAQAIREARTDWQAVPMLCSQEPITQGMMPLCIRTLLQWETADTDVTPRPVYLKDACQLRPEFT